MSAVLRALELAIAEAERGNTDFIAEIEDGKSPNLWAQATWEYFNVALVANQLPLLDPKPHGVQLAGWEPGAFVTVSHTASDLPELASYLEGLIDRCWGRTSTDARLKPPE
jgi:hypothetical protein